MCVRSFGRVEEGGDGIEQDKGAMKNEREGDEKKKR